MSRTFSVHKDPYCTNEIIYTKDAFKLHPGVTVLVGCNGIGKSTLLRRIEEALEEEGSPVMRYDNLCQGGETAKSKAVLRDNMEVAASLMLSSEGEQIAINLGETAAEIGRFVRKNKGAPEIWLLFDAIDSGLSIDNIEDVKKYLFDTILNDNPSSDVYIIVSANEYEMCRGENCFDTRNGEYITFSDYEQYREFILRSREEKDNRHKKTRNQKQNKKE